LLDCLWPLYHGRENWCCEPLLTRPKLLERHPAARGCQTSHELSMVPRSADGPNVHLAEPTLGLADKMYRRRSSYICRTRCSSRASNRRQHVERQNASTGTQHKRGPPPARCSRARPSRRSRFPVPWLISKCTTALW
jgi:hypothetical protein